jgi:hypothetical protein
VRLAQQERLRHLPVAAPFVESVNGNEAPALALDGLRDRLDARVDGSIVLYVKFTTDVEGYLVISFKEK